MSDYIGALKLLLKTRYPLFKIKIGVSPKRFDEVIQDDGGRYDEMNESFILTHHMNHNVLIIEIICLYSDSLTITIEISELFSENIFLQSDAAAAKNDVSTNQ
ncbi:hypothetical protein JHU04_001509 [Brenneria sp. 4F2]|nr:hypothetical protein [Brenneria bubanii]